MDTVLVGIDGTEGAQQAVQWTAELAGAVGARVLAVHVMPTSLEWDLAVVQVDSQVVARDRRAALLGDWTASLRAADVEYSTKFLRGSPARVLLEVAEKEAVDLIVIGTKRHWTLHDAILGGTAHELVNRSRYPVTLIPARRKAH